MESNVWHNLPTHVIEGVLTKLPYSSILEFRSVCKSWNRLLLDQIHEQESHKPWFVSGMVTANKLAYYRPLSSLKKWHFPTLPSLNMVCSDRVVPVGSMGGLVCLRKTRPETGWFRELSLNLFMWNPLTNDCRHLPRMAKRDSTFMLRFVGMYVNCTKNEYKLITTDRAFTDMYNSSTNAIVTEMYNSSTNAWKICDSPFPYNKTILSSCLENICSNSSVYSIKKVRRGRPLTIFAFEMTTEVWRVIEAPMEGFRIKRPNLVELHNKVCMVAHIVGGDNNICIWGLLEHENGRGEWIEEHQLPHDLSAQLWAKKRWRCMGNGDFLFFKIRGSQELFIYNILKRSWSSQIPACDLEICNKWNFIPMFHGPCTSSPGRMSP